MSRKTWVILIAGASILLLNNLNIFGNSGLGVTINFALTIFIIYRAIVLIKRIGKANKIMPAKPTIRQRPPVTIPSYKTLSTKANNIKTSPTTANNNGLNPVWVTTAIFLFLLVCFSYKNLAALSLNFFVWGDHILGMSNGNWPVLMWTIAGLFFGAMAGSIVIWKKYHIQFKWCLATIVPFFLLLIGLSAASDPLGSIKPSALPLAVDTTHIDTTITRAVIVKPKKHHNTKMAISTDSTAQQVDSLAGCATELGDISINARVDSVMIFYRTVASASTTWSRWKSKFIVQPGQFSLTDDGEPKANKVQYYYERGSIQSRSAQKPYIKTICDGPLIIDAN